jgi:serine/threonine protein kinase
MGSVYEAEHIRINRKVAIKVMHEAHTSKPISVERFKREAQAASAIGHPNIIEIQDIVQEEDGTTAIVMELLKGESLDTILKEKGPIPPARAVSLVLQTLSALHFAHLKGIIHRDLKPDNIFVAVNGRGQEEVKLLDFGIAKFMDDEKDPDMGLTKTGTVLGTPYYLAPEQARGGKDIDARIDIWSAGVMLYETISGEVPFDGDNYNEILGSILLEPPIPLDELVPNLPGGLVSVVEKALVKDKDLRYQSVTEMIGALLPFLDKEVGALSAPVARALKESVDPPPFELERHRKVALGEKKQVVAKSNSNAITHNITSNAIDTSRITVGKMIKDTKVARLLMAFSAVILLAVVIGLIFAFGDPSEGGNHLAEPRLENSLFEKSEKSSLKNYRAGELQANEPEKVTIRLHGLPEDAEVSLDEKALLPPFELSKSDQSRRLNVNAPGYRRFSQELIPDGDKTVKISMTKKRKRSSRSSLRPKKKKQTDTAQEKRGEVWTSNPFLK